MKLKSFCTAKETINKMKRQPTEWEKILANNVTKKGSIFKVYKQLIKHNKNNNNNIVHYRNDRISFERTEVVRDDLLTLTHQFTTADNGQDRCILQCDDELIQYGRDNDTDRLRQDDFAHSYTIGQTQASCSFHLAFVDCRDTTSENFRQICTSIQTKNEDRCIEGRNSDAQCRSQTKVDKEGLNH